MSFLQERGLEAKPLSWQHCRLHLCASFLRYIAGAKFQLQFLYISRDILDFAICLHTVTTNDVTTYFNFNISRMREDITKRIHHFSSI